MDKMTAALALEVVRMRRHVMQVALSTGIPLSELPGSPTGDSTKELELAASQVTRGWSTFRDRVTARIAELREAEIAHKAKMIEASKKLDLDYLFTAGEDFNGEV